MLTGGKKFETGARAVLGIFSILVGASLQPASAFDHSRYKPAKVEDILRYERPPSGRNVFPLHHVFQFQVTLEQHPYDCDAGALKLAMLTVGVPKQQLDNVPISKCIRVKSASGQSVQMFIQNVVAGYLGQEVQIGGALTVYVLVPYVDRNGPGILINEFQAADVKPG